LIEIGDLRCKNDGESDTEGEKEREEKFEGFWEVFETWNSCSASV
jgi:hypothetical protein